MTTRLLLLVGALVALSLAPGADARPSLCQRKCAEEGGQPLCGYHEDEGQELFWVYENQCHFDCALADFPDREVVEYNITLAPECQRQLEETGTYDAVCLICAAYPRSPGFDEEAAAAPSPAAAPPAADDDAFQGAPASPNPSDPEWRRQCEQGCADGAYAPVCAGLLLGGDSFYQAFPNECAYICMKTATLNPRWSIVEDQIELPARCQQQWSASGYLWGACVECPTRLNTPAALSSVQPNPGF